MHRAIIGRAIFIALACVLCVPLMASAQSSIVGLVRDESGGVLPGVTVEGSSPVLIEKVRTNVTDEQGRYRLVDLRPGTYRLTFSLTGFSTVVRDGVELPANFTATVNADLKVGSLQETVTVSGAAPMVDVQQASKTQVLTRDLADTLPTTRNIFSVGILVPGVRQQTPDVGGSRSMEQAYMRAHGIASNNTMQLVDGMLVNSHESDNCCMSYVDDAFQAEASVMTSGIPAETNLGGIRINIIPKDGGNVVSGAVFVGGTNGTWQSDNIDAALRARKIAAANGVAHIQNFNGAMGGPIKRDKIWFFISARHTSTDETVANVPKEIILPDGTIIRSILDQFVRDGLLRLVWQVSPNNKFGVWYERVWKRKGKDFVYGQDPRAAEQRNEKGQMYGEGQVKWTSTLTSKLLVEAGYSSDIVRYSAFNQPGAFKTPGTSEAYAWAQKTDTALNASFYPQCAYVTGCTLWMSVNNRRVETNGMQLAGSVSYVTGTHNLKMGFQDTFGPVHAYRLYNGDLVMNYVNGKPSTVTVYNTPVVSKPNDKYDVGLYVQDAWTIKRLTLNPGVRVQYFKSEMQETSMAAGRFVPARFFVAQPDLPKWGPDWAPRFSAAYDLFGDGKTAVKGSVNKYFAPWTGGYASRYANSAVLSESRNWYDADLNPGTSTISGVVLPTNGDNIAQDNEIGPSASGNFGTRSDRNPAPDLRNFSNWEYTASLQHQLFPRVSVTAGYFHRSYRDLMIIDRQQITNADYTSFTTTMPDFSNDPTLAGVLDPSEILTIYNLNSAKRSVYNASQVDTNSTGALGGLANQSIYNGVEVSFSARLARGTMLGGWTMEKNISVFCDTNDDPNGVSSSDMYQGAAVASGGRFCDMRQFDVPFRHEFKVSGTYPLPYGVDFGAVVQSYPGSPRVITWQPAASLFPGGRTNAETIILTKPGAAFLPRYSQLDINFKKNFRAGRKRFSVQVDLFNALNANAIWSTNNTIGSSLGQVTSILMGRLPRLAFQMQW
jgi:hypothetical protein